MSTSKNKSFYFINYKKGHMPIGELPIGSLVVDPTWVWEFRFGARYGNHLWIGGPKTDPGEVEPVTWIVVAKNHYDDLQEHVTLLSEKLIGLYPYDNSGQECTPFEDYHPKKHQVGYSYWNHSGTGNATLGLRPWLNSNGIHKDAGFLRSFSDSFKESILLTVLPNCSPGSGSTYNTKDKVFIPSSTELGDEKHNATYRIGKVYPLFLGAKDFDRISYSGKNRMSYWTRSPCSYNDGLLRGVLKDGNFSYRSDLPAYQNNGVRPVLNFRSDILISEKI